MKSKSSLRKHGRETQNKVTIRRKMASLRISQQRRRSRLMRVAV